jgi:hypothetical protein
MNHKMYIGLSLAAGLLGGFLSHYVPSERVHAQTETLPVREIRAQGFVLVNDDGSPAGLFGFDKDGKANIVLLDAAGKVVWKAIGPASTLNPDPNNPNPRVVPK